MRRKRRPQHDPHQLMLFSDEEMSGVADPVDDEPVASAPPRLIEGSEMVVDLLKNVMALLDHYDSNDVRLIAMQSAALVQRGIDHSLTYQLPAVPGYEFRGDVLAGLAYVSIARSFPNMIESIGLHWEEAYQKAMEAYLRS